MTVAGDDWLGLLRRTADSVAAALRTFDRWTQSGDRPDQYALDQVADVAALDVLDAAGVSVLSEESGLRRGVGNETVIVDPVDGSTNASRRIPHYCISLCVVEGLTPVAGLVRHLVSGEEFTAITGGGAHCDGHRSAQAIAPDPSERSSASPDAPAPNCPVGKSESSGRPRWTCAPSPVAGSTPTSTSTRIMASGTMPLGC